jgi:hypothetical protein
VLKQLAARLTRDYGSGFSHSGLTRMAKFYDHLPNENNVATLSQQLSWSHFVELIKVDDPTRRSFYTDLCAQSRWSVRALRERMDGLLFIELKLGEFRPEHKGQVELYLTWLAKHEQQPGENAPIAIILCSDKDAEVVELMDLEPDHIHVAEYWLQLPPQEVLRERLHKALVEARTRLELREDRGDA